MSYQSILCPVDHAGCAGQVLAHAATFARAFDAELVVLSVVDPPPGAMVGVADVVLALEEEARAAVAPLLAPLNVGAVRHEVKVGLVVETILACLEDCKGDLIVMGTHGRTGLRRMLLGSVAESLVRQSPVPVVIVRATAGTADQHSAEWQRAAAEQMG